MVGDTWPLELYFGMLIHFLISKSKLSDVWQFELQKNLETTPLYLNASKVCGSF